MTSHRSLKALLQRLDRLAGEINTFVLVLAVCLAILDLAVLAVVDLPLPPPVLGTSDAALGSRSFALGG